MRVGGQAIMEGVLMRSPNFWGMAVRTPSGDVDLRAERFRSVTRRSRLFRLPIIRGALSLGETLWLGMKALTVSTNIALGGVASRGRVGARAGTRGSCVSP